MRLRAWMVRHPSVISTLVFAPGIVYASVMTRMAYVAHGDFNGTSLALVWCAYVAFWLVAFLPYALVVLVVATAIVLILTPYASSAARRRREGVPHVPLDQP